MDRTYKAAPEEINWITLPTKWVDIDTGEQITEQQAKRDYVIIKTEKHVEHTKTKRIIEYTKQCRTSRQGKLFE